ncbi:Sodium/pantothenate symporter [Planctomycetes bacterium Pan216]|uniref:Sodium/pantothenate symporter n=1 Tax=Kolteria novifilia TaxID=2527975 RepID=A0A518AZU2_9BACT|nr:Sodium/pantothenate symporter [Planctomycetes bacterium Pan216]
MPTTPDVATDVTDTALLGPGGIAFLSLYLVSLLLVGLAGRAVRKENSLADFFLGGRGMGFFVLLLTLYATQYSGNTLIGFAAQAYRQGYAFLVSVTFMTAVIGCYLIFAPKLQRLSKQHDFITPGDYFHFRYGSRALAVLATIIGIIALGNYIVTNLKAIGTIVESATGHQISFTTGVIALSFIMVVYETLGGLRSVAWTDVIQGILLMVGCLCIFGAIQWHYGGLTGMAEQLQTIKPEFWTPPTWSEKRTWLSTLILVFAGIPLYPHAIQRIYAARSAGTLKRSLQFMVFMPLATTLFMVLVGIIGAARFPDLSKDQSEQITLRLLQDIAAHIPAVSMLIVVFLSAAVAAIMSTVDSALLSIASMFTQDLYRPMRSRASQSHLTRVGKMCSWLVMALSTLLAINLPQTIYFLMEIKLELLCQIAPAMLLGIHFPRLRSMPVLCGLVVGVVFYFGLFFTLRALDMPRLWDVHSGIWALLANLATIGLLSWLLPETPRTSASSPQVASN